MSMKKDAVVTVVRLHGSYERGFCKFFVKSLNGDLNNVNI